MPFMYQPDGKRVWVARKPGPQKVVMTVETTVHPEYVEKFLDSTGWFLYDHNQSFVGQVTHARVDEEVA